MKNNKKILIISITFFIVLCIVGSVVISLSNSIKSKKNENQKIISEILYLDNKFSNIYNYLETDNIGWDKIKIEIKDIYASWNYIIIDLSSNNQIKNTDIINFGKNLDEIYIGIEQKNSDIIFLNMGKLYNLISVYANNTKLDEQKKLELKSKEYLFNAFSLIYTNNWDLIGENIVNAEELFYNYLNQVSNAIKDNSKANKVYISIKELENAIRLKNEELFVIKLKIVLNNY